MFLASRLYYGNIAAAFWCVFFFCVPTVCYGQQTLKIHQTDATRDTGHFQRTLVGYLVECVLCFTGLWCKPAIADHSNCYLRAKRGTHQILFVILFS